MRAVYCNLLRHMQHYLQHHTLETTPMTNCTTKFTADWVIRALRDEMTSMTDDDRVAVLELLLQHECTDPAASALRDYLREVCARVQAAEAASKAA